MMEASVQTSSEDLRASVAVNTPQELLGVVRSLKLSIEKFDKQFESLSPELKDGITNGIPHVAKGVQILKVIRDALEQVLSFLESPLGQTSVNLVAQHMDKLRVMVEVGAGVMVSGLFVVVVGQLLDVNKGEFDSVIRTIKSSQTFVRDRLPEIERRVIEASDHLKQLRDAVDQSDNKRVKSLFWHFQETLRLAKMDIDDCEEKLHVTNEKIDEALDKINVRMQTSGICRGAFISLSAIWIYHLIKWKTIPFSVGVAFGGGCLYLGLSVLPPVYNSLKGTFHEYKVVHDELHAELRRLKRNLDNHQRKYEADFKPTRSVGSGDSSC